MSTPCQCQDPCGNQQAQSNNSYLPIPCDGCEDFIHGKCIDYSGLATTCLDIQPGTTFDEFVVAMDGAMCALLNGQEDKYVKVSGNDDVSSFLIDKLEAGDNVALSITNPGADEKLRIDVSVSSAIDQKVKVSANDDTSQYLDDKIVAGAGVTKTILNPGSVEQIRIDIAEIDTLNDVVTRNGLVTKPVTSSAGNAFGTYWTQALTAASDNANLYGMYIQPTFNIGVHTGVKTAAFATKGYILSEHGDGTAGIGRVIVASDANAGHWAELAFGTDTFYDYGYHLRVSQVDGYGLFAMRNTQVWRTWDSGNLLIGTGTTDSGYLLDVQGDMRIGTVPEYADNAAALLGGLVAGAVYRTGDNLKIVH